MAALEIRSVFSHMKLAYPASISVGPDRHHVTIGKHFRGRVPAVSKVQADVLRNLRVIFTRSSKVVSGLNESIQMLIIGGVAGATSRTMTAPMDRIKVVFQAGSINLTNEQRVSIRRVVEEIYTEGGWRSFFKGNGVNVLKIAPETGIKFYTNTYLTSYFKKESSSSPETLQRLLAGSMAGVVAQTSIYPLEIAKTRLALSKPGEYSGIWNCLQSTVARNGVTSLYRGFVPSIVGIIPYAGVELAVFTSLRDWYQAEYGVKPAVVPLLGFGCTASVAGQLVAYPLNLVRTKMQAQGMQGRPVIYNGMVDCLTKVFKAEGVRGLYRGIVPGFAKTLPAISISYTVFETLKSKSL